MLLSIIRVMVLIILFFSIFYWGIIFAQHSALGCLLMSLPGVSQYHSVGSAGKVQMPSLWINKTQIQAEKSYGGNASCSVLPKNRRQEVGRIEGGDSWGLYLEAQTQTSWRWDRDPRREAVGRGEDCGALLPLPGASQLQLKATPASVVILLTMTCTGQAQFPLFCVITEKTNFTEKKRLRHEEPSQDKLERKY